MFYPQLGDVLDLARAFPDANIVLNHMGGPLGLGHYAARPEEAFLAWRAAIRPLANCVNVSVKIGGATNRLYNFMGWKRPPTGAELAERWRPYVETTIATFGPRRCMFASSFPVDKVGAGYRAHWNAFKLLTASASTEEKAAMFSGTARRVHGLRV